MFWFGLLLISWAAFVSVTTTSADSSWESVAADIPRCKFSDSECLSTVVMQILQTHHAKGHRGLNIIPFDPLHIKSLILPKIPNSPVNIELKFKDIDLVGISKATVSKVKGFTETPSNLVFEITGNVPQMIVTGPYSVNGQVLILPIIGQGKSKIVFEDTNVIAKFKCSTVEKNGKTYLNIVKARLDLQPQKMIFNLENLFNGDKALGDNMNHFLNDNWKDVYTELKLPIGEAISEIFIHIANAVFSKFSYSELFLNS